MCVGRTKPPPRRSPRQPNRHHRPFRRPAQVVRPENAQRLGQFGDDLDDHAAVELAGQDGEDGLGRPLGVPREPGRQLLLHPVQEGLQLPLARRVRGQMPAFAVDAAHDRRQLRTEMHGLIRGQSIAQRMQHSAQGAQRMLALRQVMLGHELLDPDVDLLDGVVDRWQMAFTHCGVSQRPHTIGEKQRVLLDPDQLPGTGMPHRSRC